MKKNKQQVIEERRLYTVKQFIDRQNGGWPSTSALRALILNAARGKNSFQSAFKRVNRRVLIDSIEFWNIVEKIQPDFHKKVKKSFSSPRLKDKTRRDYGIPQV